VFINPHADQTRWDLLSERSVEHDQVGTGRFWFKLRSGQMVFAIMDPTTGTPTTQEAMYWIQAEQWYVNNPISQGGVTGAKIPQGN
jgi:hypothetical protein